MQLPYTITQYSKEHAMRDNMNMPMIKQMIRMHEAKVSKEDMAKTMNVAVSAIERYLEQFCAPKKDAAPAKKDVAKKAPTKKPEPKE